MRKETEARSLLLYGGVLLAAFFLFVGTTRSALAATGYANGSLVKGTPSAVYFVTAEGTRMAFPNEATYFSWYKDFSTVKTISDDALAALPLSALVTLKPGLSAVRVESDNAIYAVAHGGVFRKIASPELAAMIFGSDWDSKATIVPNAFYESYTIGDEVTGSGQYWWKQEKDKSPDISADRDLTPVAVAAKSSDAKTAPSTGAGSAEPVKNDPSKDALSAVVINTATDEKGYLAPNRRYFRADYSKLANIPTITITEKSSGTVLASGEMKPMPPAKTIFNYSSPVLKEKTTYLWKISASELGASADAKKTDYAGEFTTTDFDTAVDSYKATNVLVFKYDDGKGANGEDARGLVAKFSDPPDRSMITVKEKSSGAVIGFEESGDNYTKETQYAVIPDNWTSKLKPKTTYVWEATADFTKANGEKKSDSMTGEFTTSDFSAGNNTAVAVAPSGVFAINSVVVQKIDAKGQPAENTRSFKVDFSAVPADGNVSVSEKGSLYDVNHFKLKSSGAPALSMILKPIITDNRLLPGKTYQWIITAIAPHEGDLTDDELLDRGLYVMYVGEFTTASSF